jgi:hydroxymethylbilane synthase
MPKSRLVLSFGTLGSSLAKSQTQAVISRLQEIHPRLTCQMTIVPSPLDNSQRGGEAYLAATAAEVEFLEEQLLAGEFRYVVQRAQDLVLPLRKEVAYAAVPPRDTPFDAFLNRQGLIADEMPEHAVIGVLNIRTKAQMQHLWPRLTFQIVPGGLDGALESFLRRCDLDGLVLPAAAAEHLGIQGIVTEIFYPELMLPSSGQGILVVLNREDDQEGRDLLKDLHSEVTFREMEAEHSFMQRFTSDQDLPIGVLAQVDRKKICVTGCICSLHGMANQETAEGDTANAAQIGTDLAERLLLSGESFIDLLEADFPDGLPEEELENTRSDTLTDALADPLVDPLVDPLSDAELTEEALGEELLGEDPLHDNSLHDDKPL